MSGRFAAVLALSLTLGLARVLGLHFHVAEPEMANPGASVRPAAFETPHHHGEEAESLAAAHADDDDIDVDSPAQVVNKAALPAAVAPPIGAVFFLLATLASATGLVVAAPFRPPRIPSLRTRLPPSHAPPCTT